MILNVKHNIIAQFTRPQNNKETLTEAEIPT